MVTPYPILSCPLHIQRLEGLAGPDRAWPDMVAIQTALSQLSCLERPLQSFMRKRYAVLMRTKKASSCCHVGSFYE